MNKLLLFLFFIPFLGITQNSHTINTIGNTFSPNSLTINIGDTVNWYNTGGSHNVNATLVTFPNNPEGFGNTVSSSAWTFQWVFTLSGTYDYQCDPHAGMGMVGQVIVNSIPALTYVPDDWFEQALINLGYDDVLDDSVLTSNINTVTHLNLSPYAPGAAHLPIDDLTGIEDFISLIDLDCRGNDLNNIDLSQNSALTILNCSGNYLSSLDLSFNSGLTYLDCSGNKLPSLDLIHQTALTYLDCSFQTEYASQISGTPWLQNLNISNCTSLIEIYCQDNVIDSLDVSAITSLTTLHCEENQLTSLNVSNNSILTTLQCGFNQLSSLFTSGADSLTTLNCEENYLSFLDMSNNPVLTYLNCSDQHGVLSSLDLRNTLIGNGGNGNPYNLYLDAKNNLGLFCIDVSDASWATYFWGGTVAVDSWVSFSLDCDLIWGCTDITSPNYDSLATADDGSCIYYGCTDTTACNYDQSANTNDGECSYVFCVGCTDPVACNYDSTATIDDGSCNYITIPSLNITACDSLIFYEATYDSSGIYSVVIPGDTSLFNNLQFPEIDGEPGWNYSGSSVSISSNGLIVAVGAEIGDYVKVYSWDTLNFHWDQLGSMIQVDPESISLSSDGYTVAIGGSNYPTSNSGIVRIYQFVNGDWYQKGQDLNGDANYDYFGFSISLSNDGNTVAVGARGKDDNGSNSGQVRIYTYNGTSWNQLGQDIDGESAGDYSGGSVSLSSDGSTVAIGAASNDGNGSSSGHVRVYQNNGGVWNQIGQDIDGEASQDRSGESVSLSSDGNIVAIGAPKNHEGNGSSSGHVRVYQNNGGVWNQIGQDIDGEASQDRSGESVSLSSGGNIVAIGAKFNDGNGSDAGHVILYEYEDSIWVKVGQDIDGEAADDLSGKSVALSSDGKTVVIGAPNNDGNGNLSGHIRVYNTILDVACDSVINLNLIIVNNATGCTDSIACNYDSTALCDDGSCIYPGCTDSLSINYDPAAGCDDGSCCYDSWVTLNMYDSYGDGWNGDYFTMTNVAASTVVFNVTLDNGSIGYENGCVPNGCYDIVVDGGSWQSEVSWTLVYGTGNIIASGGSPYLGQVCVYFGCTDSTSTNYDPTSTVDDGTCVYVPGCMDATACNYDALADFDDGSCEWTSCVATCGAITGVNLTDVIHDRAQFNWDDMNDSSCVVDQIRIRYREVGSSSWSLKTMGAPVGNSAPCLNTSKLVLNLMASTQYEYDFKIWYQSGTVVNWHSGGTFTTADACLNATNVTATPNSSTQTDFCWTNPATHEFVRLKYRIDSAGTSFSNIGGFGVMAPATCKTKNGLTPGTDYRVMWRTWCSATGGPYRSPVWDGPVTWTQPSSIRVEGGTTINNLDVYPNPSRDVFNITFTSEEIQDLKVRVLNVVGEVIISSDLDQFVGEYTRQINLHENAKGIYFLEIETNDGVVNKKLILQ